MASQGDDALPVGGAESEAASAGDASAAAAAAIAAAPTAAVAARSPSQTAMRTQLDRYQARIDAQRPRRPLGTSGGSAGEAAPTAAAQYDILVHGRKTSVMGTPKAAAAAAAAASGAEALFARAALAVDEPPAASMEAPSTPPPPPQRAQSTPEQAVQASPQPLRSASTSTATRAQRQKRQAASSSRAGPTLRAITTPSDEAYHHISDGESTNHDERSSSNNATTAASSSRRPPSSSSSTRAAGSSSASFTSKIPVATRLYKPPPVRNKNDDTLQLNDPMSDDEFSIQQEFTAPKWRVPADAPRSRLQPPQQSTSLAQHITTKRQELRPVAQSLQSPLQPNRNVARHDDLGELEDSLLLGDASPLRAGTPSSGSSTPLSSVGVPLDRTSSKSSSGQGTPTSRPSKAFNSVPDIPRSSKRPPASQSWASTDASTEPDLFGNVPRVDHRFASANSASARLKPASSVSPTSPSPSGGMSPAESATRLRTLTSSHQQQQQAAVSPQLVANTLRPPPSISKVRRTVSESDGPSAAAMRAMQYNAQAQQRSPGHAQEMDLFGSLPHRDSSTPNTPEIVPAAAMLGHVPNALNYRQHASSQSSAALSPQSLKRPATTHPNDELWQNLMHHVRVVTPPWEVPIPTFPVNRIEMMKVKKQLQQAKTPIPMQKQRSKTKERIQTETPPKQTVGPASLPRQPSLIRAHWSVDDVSAFLTTLGSVFEAYITVFRSALIDGRQLLVLDDDDLVALGVTGLPNSRIHRKTLLRAIADGAKAAGHTTHDETPAYTRTPPVAPRAIVDSPLQSLPVEPSPPMPQGVSILRASSLSSITRLGAGNFGVTFTAIYLDPKDPSARPIDVVIKVPRTRSGADEWHELLAFLDVPQHRHVLPLIGICTDFDAGHLDETTPTPHTKKNAHTCCFVTLYMARGSLKDILVNDELSTRLLGGNILDATLHGAPAGSLEARIFTSILHEATRLLLNIAEGLRHLHSHGILHRDIATRNILVNAQGDALVSDFGLSRKVTPGAGIKDARNMHQDIGLDTTGATSGYYRLAQPEQTALPLRWMSAESLCEYLFTTASDVWMFGVCGWELLTRAEKIPYHDLSSYNQLMAKVGGGARRLELPAYVPPRLAALISSCWRYEGRDRPTMSEIATELREIMQEQAIALGATNGLSHDDVTPVEPGESSSPSVRPNLISPTLDIPDRQFKMPLIAHSSAGSPAFDSASPSRPFSPASLPLGRPRDTRTFGSVTSITAVDSPDGGVTTTTEVHSTMVAGSKAAGITAVGQNRTVTTHASTVTRPPPMHAPPSAAHASHAPVPAASLVGFASGPPSSEPPPPSISSLVDFVQSVTTPPHLHAPLAGQSPHHPQSHLVHHVRTESASLLAARGAVGDGDVHYQESYSLMAAGSIIAPPSAQAGVATHAASDSSSSSVSVTPSLSLLGDVSSSSAGATLPLSPNVTNFLFGAALKLPSPVARADTTQRKAPAAAQ